MPVASPPLPLRCCSLLRRGPSGAMELLAKAPVLSCAAKRNTGAAAADSPMGPLVGALAKWIHWAVPPPPPPRVCGTPGGPPVTAPRVRLRDGRHLAYAESGVRKEDARFKVVFSHGFTGSRLDSLRAAPVSGATPHFIPLFLRENSVSAMVESVSRRAEWRICSVEKLVLQF